MLKFYTIALTIAALCATGSPACARDASTHDDVEVTGTINLPANSLGNEIPFPSAKAQDIATQKNTEIHPAISVKTVINKTVYPQNFEDRYHWLENLSQFNSEFINRAGKNSSKSNNEGRSGVSAFRATITQDGNGDAGAYYANCQISGQGNPGSTHWLAQPACVILNGDVGTVVPHSYLNVQEFSLSDNNRDAAAIGTVFRFDRTNNTASQGEVWMGVRNQSTGTKSIDVGISNAGLINIALDTVLERADPQFSSGQVVAVNMAADQKIIYNSTSRPMNGIDWYGNQLGSAYDTYSQQAKELKRCNGASCLSVGNGTVRVANAGLRLTVVRAADLPTCDGGSEGTLYAVSDATAETYNADLTGAGSYHVMAYCNGNRWKVR